MRAFIEGDSQESNKCVQDHQLFWTEKARFPSVIASPVSTHTLKKQNKKHSSLNFNLKIEVEDSFTFGMPRVCELILPHADCAEHLEAIGSLLSGAAIGRRRM